MWSTGFCQKWRQFQNLCSTFVRGRQNVGGEYVWVRATRVLKLHSNPVESVVRNVSVWKDVTVSLFCRVLYVLGVFLLCVCLQLWLYLEVRHTSLVCCHVFAGSCSPNIELGLVSQTNTLFANSVSAGHRCTIDSRVEVLYYICLCVPW